jgi:hypothetical protein
MACKTFLFTTFCPNGSHHSDSPLLVAFLVRTLLKVYRYYSFQPHLHADPSMCAVMHLLAAHPEIQAKVREEVHSVVGDMLIVPSIQQQKQLVYLNAVI